MNIKYLILICASALIFCGCDQFEGLIDSIDPSTEEVDDNDEPEDEDDNETGNGDPAGTGDNDISEVDDDSADDTFVLSDYPGTITVEWSASGATITNSTELPCSQDGGYVTLGNAESELTGLHIVLKGSTTDGSIKIYNQKKYVLTLDGVSITSKKGAAINNQCGKRTFVVLTDGTTSSLADASSYSDVPEGEDCKGCFFSEAKLVFSGKGTLKVAGAYKHAIASDDYIRIFSGNINITAAASDGIHVNDYVRMDGGSLTATTKGDGIDSEDYVNILGGTVGITTSGSKSDGIKAVGNLFIAGGNVTVTTNGTAAKALKSDNNISITGGTLNLTTTGGGLYDSTQKSNSTSSCIKAENLVSISGGTLTLKSSGSGGKGINSYQLETSGEPTISITTTGSTYSSSSDKSYSKAIKATNTIVIGGGKLTISTNTSGAEGIESKLIDENAIVFNGGETYIKAYDDAINAAGQIVVNGGYIFAQSTNNDCMDSNMYENTRSSTKKGVVFNGGISILYSTTSPEMGIDADGNNNLAFNGGTVFSGGGNQGGGSAASPTVSQPTVWASGVTLSTGYFHLTDASGNVLFSAYVPKALSGAYCMISSPLMKSGTTYYYGCSSSAPSNPTKKWESWYYEGGTTTKPSSSFSATSGYTTTGSGGSTGGGGGGWPGGGGRW